MLNIKSDNQTMKTKTNYSLLLLLIQYYLLKYNFEAFYLVSNSSCIFTFNQSAVFPL